MVPARPMTAGDGGYDEFAFARLDVPAGRLHYVDEGSGPPLLLVHGNPPSSFLYRHFIRFLRDRYRCVAPDNIGFGRSLQRRRCPLTPREHARNVRRLVRHLDLRDVVLMAHDWGGPIGLSVAQCERARLRGMVLMNTWMWPVRPGSRPWLFSLAAGSVPHALLTRWPALPVHRGMPLFTGRSARIARRALRTYAEFFRRGGDARAMRTLARHIRRSRGWLDRLWSGRDALSSIPALLLWGMDDPVFGGRELARWAQFLQHFRITRLDGIGHFVPEEAGEMAVTEVGDWLRKLNGSEEGRLPGKLRDR